MDFDAVDNFCLNVTTKAINFQDDNPSILINILKDHYVQAFDLTSMQDAGEKSHYPELLQNHWD